jgi:hypothetical protein
LNADVEEREEKQTKFITGLDTKPKKLYERD